MKKCERCGAKGRLLDDGSRELLDYCAECSADLCHECMAEGCCGKAPARSGMEEDAA